MNRKQLQKTIDALVSGGADIRSADNHRIGKLYVVEQGLVTKFYPGYGTVFISEGEQHDQRFSTAVSYAQENRYQLLLTDTEQELGGEYVFSQIPAEHLSKTTELVTPLPTLYEHLKTSA